VKLILRWPNICKSPALKYGPKNLRKHPNEVLNGIYMMPIRFKFLPIVYFTYYFLKAFYLSGKKKRNPTAKEKIFELLSLPVIRS